MDTDKHPLLLEALDAMRARFGAGAFAVVDNWDGDDIAIGVAKAADHQTLVYVAVYETGKGLFHAELELPPQGCNDLPYTPAGVRPELSLSELLEVVAEHLDLLPLSTT